MVGMGSSSSARRVNLSKQVENVFDQLITKIEAADFDPRPLMKRWNTLDRYEPIKRIACGKDYHCGMLFSCCSSSCECDNTCTNKPFQYRPLKQTKLITKEKYGTGLVTEEEIKKGDFVIEYVGEVIDDKTCEKRLWQMKRLDRGDKFYLCEVSSNMVIDATDKGNMSRFINHSCEPNTEMQKWIIDGETRVGIFALRDIKKGEELTYDSNFVQFGKNQDCHCGSSNCRKTLGKAKMVNSFILNKGNSGSSQDQHIKKKQKKMVI